MADINTAIDFVLRQEDAELSGVITENPPTIGAYEGTVPPAIPVGGGTVNGRIAE